MDSGLVALLHPRAQFDSENLMKTNGKTFIWMLRGGVDWLSSNAISFRMHTTHTYLTDICTAAVKCDCHCSTFWCSERHLHKFHNCNKYSACIASRVYGDIMSRLDLLRLAPILVGFQFPREIWIINSEWWTLMCHTNIIHYRANIHWMRREYFSAIRAVDGRRAINVNLAVLLHAIGRARKMSEKVP